MWSRRGACFLCGIHEFSMSLRNASVINSKRVVVVVWCVWEEVREVGLHLSPVCAKFEMDRRLVSIWVRTNHTMDMLVSHPLHATVST